MERNSAGVNSTSLGSVRSLWIVVAQYFRSLMVVNSIQSIYGVSGLFSCSLNVHLQVQHDTVGVLQNKQQVFASNAASGFSCATDDLENRVRAVIVLKCAFYFHLTRMQNCQELANLVGFMRLLALTTSLRTVSREISSGHTNVSPTSISSHGYTWVFPVV